jgi:hypothetical protein
MTLKISYDCNKTLANGNPDPEEGIHLILTDECYEGLEKEIGNLSEEEKEKIRKEKRLCKMNVKYAINMFGYNGEQKVLCPSCGNEYILTRNQVVNSYNKYIDNHNK